MPKPRSLGRRALFLTAASAMVLGLLLAFFDRGLTPLIVPLAGMRATIGVLALVTAAAYAWRTGTRPLRGVAIGVAVVGTAQVAWALIPFARLATTTTVRFRSHETDLVGSWFVPRSAGPHGAVVVVHGSGSMTRRVYRAWAEPFLRAGYAVFVYDKRGVGDSQGLYEEQRNTSPENIQLLADDARAALAVAAGQAGVDRSKVGYFGISQAGWIIPRALQADTLARFAIMLGGSAVSVGEQNYFDSLSGDDHLGFREPALPMQELEARVEVRPPSGFDPRPDIGALPVPALWIYGDLDTSTPVRKSAQALDSIRRDGRRGISIQRYPTANHVGLIVRGEGSRIPPQFVPRLWDRAVRWADSVTSRE